MEQNENQEVELDMNHLMKVRKEKLDNLVAEGKNPFEITKFNRTNSAAEIKANYEQFEQKDVTVAGRIIAKRIMGKASFCTIQDSDEKIQSYVSKNVVKQATVTDIRKLKENEIIEEIAKMTNGEVTETSKKHAMELRLANVG